MNFFQGQSSLRGCQKMLSFWPNSQCETIATCWFVKNLQKVLTEENIQLIFCNILPEVIGFFDVLRLKLFPKQLKESTFLLNIFKREEIVRYFFFCFTLRIFARQYCNRKALHQIQGVACLASCTLLVKNSFLIRNGMFFCE